MELGCVLLLLLGLGGVGGSSNFISDSWAMLTGERSAQPRCLPIPPNLTLCHNIDYPTMRLPNLLDHETLDEVVQQASSWVPLLRLNCHPDAQLFLCSLFAPVCLEREIKPCRSLCEAVRGGCEERMRLYGFPWPAMLNCARFPPPHDMCIKPRHTYIEERNRTCKACSQIPTYENILDHFCRSQFVAKVKLATLGSNRVITRRGQALKPQGYNSNFLDRQSFYFTDKGDDCPCEIPA